MARHVSRRGVKFDLVDPPDKVLRTRLPSRAQQQEQGTLTRGGENLVSLKWREFQQAADIPVSSGTRGPLIVNGRSIRSYPHDN